MCLISTDELLKAIMTKPTRHDFWGLVWQLLPKRWFFEDFDIIPLWMMKKTLSGVITRQFWKNFRTIIVATCTPSDQMIANLKPGQACFSFEVEPHYDWQFWKPTQGVLAEMVKEVVYRIMEKQEQNGLVIEEMMFLLSFRQLRSMTSDDYYQVSLRPDVELIWPYGYHGNCP